jgi:hypothetical protein
MPTIPSNARHTPKPSADVKVAFLEMLERILRRWSAWLGRWILRLVYARNAESMDAMPKRDAERAHLRQGIGPERSVAPTESLPLNASGQTGTGQC